MLQVDLSTLSGPELRQLLDTTRDRGQAALSYQVLQEMAARREREQQESGARLKLLRGRRRSEPRVIELNLGDPLDKKDDLDFDDDIPDLPAADHDPVSSLTLDRARSPGPPPVRRTKIGRAGFAVGMAVGLAAGGALGVGVAEITHSGDPAPAMAAAYPPAPAAPMKAATLPLVVEAPPAPEIPTDVAAAPAPAPVEVAALAEAEATPEEVVVPPVEKPPEKKIEVAAEEAPPPVARKCAAQPTPADRAICEEPELQRLQRDLRQAYARAMEVHADRDVLRQRQLAWRDARNAVSDPQRLAGLYEQRIRRLNAAAADAEARR